MPLDSTERDLHKWIICKHNQLRRCSVSFSVWTELMKTVSRLRHLRAQGAFVPAKLAECWERIWWWGQRRNQVILQVEARLLRELSNNMLLYQPFVNSKRAKARRTHPTTNSTCTQHIPHIKDTAHAYIHPLQPTHTHTHTIFRFTQTHSDWAERPEE